MKKRRPAVAGQFYPASGEALKESIRGCFLHDLGPKRLPPLERSEGPVYGLISPHAGYMYSGPVASHGYLAISPLDIELFVLVGPNHWGLGSGIATFREGSWETPLGEVEIDSDAAKELVEGTRLVDYDEEAHRMEHSLEVQVPFLQFTFPKGFKILPISLALQDRGTSEELGEGLYSLVKGRRALLIASSDLTHYEPHSLAAKKDAELIDRIRALDIPGYYTVLERRNVTACGYGAIAAVMKAARLLGAKEGRLLKYGTSGETGGDYGSVVGYASILLV